MPSQRFDGDSETAHTGIGEQRRRYLGDGGVFNRLNDARVVGTAGQREDCGEQPGKRRMGVEIMVIFSGVLVAAAASARRAASSLNEHCTPCRPATGIPLESAGRMLGHVDCV